MAVEGGARLLQCRPTRSPCAGPPTSSARHRPSRTSRRPDRVPRSRPSSPSTWVPHACSAPGRVLARQCGDGLRDRGDARRPGSYRQLRQRHAARPAPGGRDPGRARRRQGLRCIVVPATARIFRDAIREGDRDAGQAGAIIAPSTCGACAGLHMGVLAADQVRSHHQPQLPWPHGAQARGSYLANAYVAAASAVAGELIDPVQVGHDPLSGRRNLFGDDIDTDIIIRPLPGLARSRFLARLHGGAGAGLLQRVGAGDIHRGRRNFGCGRRASMRAGAARCGYCRCRGRAGFARIFFRNCLNQGFPVIVCPAAVDAPATAHRSRWMSPPRRRGVRPALRGREAAEFPAADPARGASCRCCASASG